LDKLFLGHLAYFFFLNNVFFLLIIGFLIMSISCAVKASELLEMYVIAIVFGEIVVVYFLVQLTFFENFTLGSEDHYIWGICCKRRLVIIVDGGVVTVALAGAEVADMVAGALIAFHFFFAFSVSFALGDKLKWPLLGDTWEECHPHVQRVLPLVLHGPLLAFTKHSFLELFFHIVQGPGRFEHLDSTAFLAT
jgi:hypothetical protein